MYVCNTDKHFSWKAHRELRVLRGHGRHILGRIMPLVDPESGGRVCIVFFSFSGTLARAAPLCRSFYLYLILEKVTVWLFFFFEG